MTAAQSISAAPQPPAAPKATPAPAPAPRISGRRNLLILGLGAILITLITTSVELWLYRSSGDIYLDRSRPGFLPDPEEAKEERPAASNYSYPDSGPLDPAELETYLTELKSVQSHLKSLSSPFSPAPLSDASLGLSPSTPAPATSDQPAKPSVAE